MVPYGADNKKDWSKVHYSTLQPQDDWQTYLDLNSAVDYYLAREYSKDNDADFYRSNFFYTNNVDPTSSDKFFMGPIWDFDRSAGAKPGGGSTTITEPTGWWIRGQGSQNHDTNSRHWFTLIAKDPRRFRKPLGISSLGGRAGGAGARVHDRHRQRPQGSGRRRLDRLGQAGRGQRPRGLEELRLALCTEVLDLQRRDRLDQGLVRQALRVDGQRAPQGASAHPN